MFSVVAPPEQRCMVPFREVLGVSETFDPMLGAGWAGPKHRILPLSDVLLDQEL